MRGGATSPSICFNPEYEEEDSESEEEQISHPGGRARGLGEERAASASVKERKALRSKSTAQPRKGAPRGDAARSTLPDTHISDPEGTGFFGVL